MKGAFLTRPEGFEPTTIGIGIRYSIRAELRTVAFSLYIIAHLSLFVKGYLEISFGNFSQKKVAAGSGNREFGEKE